MDFLKEYRDVFTWFHEDMLGIDSSVIVYKLNVDMTHKPVIQKHRRFNLERYTMISEEISKLLKANLLKDAYNHDWLANVVMVNKANKKWRICIDYTDLNKAY